MPDAASKTNINTTKTAKKKEPAEAVRLVSQDVAGILKGFPTQRVAIPKGTTKEDMTLEICYNGYNILLKRGATVDLAKPLVQLLRQSGII